MARTTPVSNGWITLVRSLGMILPGAIATTSTRPMLAQAIARQNTATMAAPIAPANGGGGVATISRAAGRNASSALLRARGFCGSGALADFMDTCLQPMQ